MLQYRYNASIGIAAKVLYTTSDTLTNNTATMSLKARKAMVRLDVRVPANIKQGVEIIAGEDYTLSDVVRDILEEALDQRLKDKKQT